MPPFIATHLRRRSDLNPGSTSTSFSSQSFGFQPSSECDFRNNAGSDSEFQVDSESSTIRSTSSLVLSSSVDSSFQGTGFLSAEMLGTLPTNRAVSGSSSDEMDGIISDHASFTIDVKARSIITGPPTMTSSDPGVGSSTPADNQKIDSSGARATSSLTSTRDGQSPHSTSPIPTAITTEIQHTSATSAKSSTSADPSSTITTEGKHPATASSASSTTIFRSTDTASTAGTTGKQRSISVTSPISEHSSNGKSVGASAPTSSSTSQLTSASLTSQTLPGHTTSTSSSSVTVPTISGVPAATLTDASASDNAETRTKGNPTISSRTSVSSTTSSDLSEASTDSHQPQTSSLNDHTRFTTGSASASVTRPPSVTSQHPSPKESSNGNTRSDGLGFGISLPWLGVSVTAGESGVGADATVNVPHPGSTASITTTDQPTRSQTDDLPSTTSSDSGDLPTQTSITSTNQRTSSQTDNLPSTTSSDNFPSTSHHPSPSINASLGISDNLPTQTSKGDGSHPNTPSQFSSVNTNRGTHTAPVATSTDSGNVNSDGNGSGNASSKSNNSDGFFTSRPLPASTPTHISGSGDSNNDHGKGNDGSSTTMQPASSNSVHSSGGGEENDGTNTATKSSSGSGNNSNGNGEQNHSTFSPQTTGVLPDVTSSSRHGFPGVTTPSSGLAKATSNPDGPSQTVVSTGPTKPVPSASASRTTTGVDSGNRPGSSGHDFTGTTTPSAFAQATTVSGSKAGPGQTESSTKPTNTVLSATASRTTGVGSAASDNFASTSHNSVTLPVPASFTKPLALASAIVSSSETSSETFSTETILSSSTKLITTTNSNGQSTTETSVSVSTSTAVVPVPLPSTSTKNEKAMVGGIVGGIVLVLLAIGFWLFYRRRYRNRSTNFVPYLNLDGDQPPRASIAHDAEAPPSPIFNPMAMVASPSRVTTPAQTTFVTRKPVPFHDLLKDENVTIKRTASFSRFSRNSYPRSSFSSQSTEPRLSRYPSSSTSNSSVIADGDSIASTVKVGELIDPFADSEPSALDNPFADSFGLRKTNISAAGGENTFRILPPVPQLRLTKPTAVDESTRHSQTSVESSHWGVAM